MNSRPLVSVCVPSYNGAEFIGETVQSVLNQSFVDFELIINDDDSSDNTLSIVKAFGDPRIRITRNDANLGMGRNWNRVLSSIMGKYVKLLCEDDLLHPRCLERQVRILEDPCNSQAILTICSRNVINHRNEVVLRRKPPIPSGIVGGRELIRRSIRTGTNLIGEPAVGMFRREAIRKEELVDPSNPFLSDLSLWAELLRAGDAFVDPECLASFRISESGASARIGLRQAACFRAFARKLRRDSFYQVGWLDVMSGCFLSFPLCLLRNAFVKLRARPGAFRSPAQPQSADSNRSGTEAEAGAPVQNHKGCECRTGRKRSCATCS